MTATLLSNRPADPATLFAEEAEDLLLECRNWLDGEPITTEAQATAVSSLLSRLRRVSNSSRRRYDVLPVNPFTNSMYSSL